MRQLNSSQHFRRAEAVHWYHWDIVFAGELEDPVSRFEDRRFVVLVKAGLTLSMHDSEEEHLDSCAR